VYNAMALCKKKKVKKKKRRKSQEDEREEVTETSFEGFNETDDEG